MRAILPLAILLLAGCQTTRARIGYLLARDTARVQIVEQEETTGCVQIGAVTASDGHSCFNCDAKSFGSKERAMRRLKQRARLRRGNALVVDPVEEIRTTSHSEGEEIILRGTAFRCEESMPAITTSPN